LALQLLVGHVVDAGAHVRAGVVDQHVDPAEALEHGAHESFARRGDRRVGADRKDVTMRLQPGLSFVEAALVARADGNAGTFLEQPFGGREANAPRRAGDDCNLALQTEVHPSVPTANFVRCRSRNSPCTVRRPANSSIITPVLPETLQATAVEVERNAGNV